MNREDVRLKLLLAREARDLTQIEAAIQIGCGITTYRMWEQGLLPSPRLMSKITRWLEEDTNECTGKSSDKV